MRFDDKKIRADVSRLHVSTPFRAPRVALLATLCLGAGCYSTSLLQEPDVLAPGKVRASVGASYDFDKKGGEATPTPELAVRVGVVENVELRGKASASGGEFGANVQLAESEQARLLVMPQYRGYRAVTEDSDAFWDEESDYDSADVRAFAVPVIAAVRTPSGVEPFVGIAPHGGRSDGHGFGALGFHFGVSLPMTKNLAVIPECSALYSLWGPGQDVKNDSAQFLRPVLEQGDTMMQCGMSISFGNAYAK